MADIEQRDEYEEEIALILIILWRAMVVQWDRDITAPPPTELRDRLVLNLYRISVEARTGLAGQFLIPVTQTWIDDAARRQANRQADAILERMRQRVIEARRAGSPSPSQNPAPSPVPVPSPSPNQAPSPATPSSVPSPEPETETTTTTPRPEPFVVTVPDYTESDASREAATTVTSTWSQAESDVADQSPPGETLTAIWMTEPGACPICEPLHATHRQTWRRAFPDGPPAHPNCRCYLRWVPSV